MLVIIDYGIGNLGSIQNMFRKIGFDSLISSSPHDIEKADKLVLSGVGSFDNGIKSLNDSGLRKIIETKVFKNRTPILGLCLGMQLFMQTSEEGKENGLGWLNGKVIKFNFQGNDNQLKIPHMGWNQIRIIKNNPIIDGLDNESRFYFVHSFHVLCENYQAVISTTMYGYEFASIISIDNIIGTQFHPEKSHKFGMKIFHNFASKLLNVN